MAIILGANSVSKLYKGGQEISKLFLGDTLIFGSSSYPNWYKDGWQELFQPDSWYYPLYVTVATATTPSSGNVPNCTILKCSFTDYYEYVSTPANVQRDHYSNTETMGYVRASRPGAKKRQLITYDAVTNTWGAVTSENNGYNPQIENVMLTQNVPAFIYNKRIPSGYPDITTNLPYIEP